jgi:hypothetical protein
MHAPGGEKQIRQFPGLRTYPVRLKPENHPLPVFPRLACPLVTLWLLIQVFSHTLNAVESMKYLPVSFPFRFRNSRYFIKTPGAAKDWFVAFRNFS